MNRPEGAVQVSLPWSCAAPDNLRKQYHSSKYGGYASAREEIRAEAHNAAVGNDALPWTGPYKLGISVFPPLESSPWELDPESFDLTNLIKVIPDGLEGPVIEDDGMCRGLTIREYPPQSRGGISLYLHVMDHDPREERPE